MTHPDISLAERTGYGPWQQEAEFIVDTCADCGAGIGSGEEHYEAGPLCLDCADERTLTWHCGSGEGPACCSCGTAILCGDRHASLPGSDRDSWCEGCLEKYRTTAWAA